MTAFRLVTAEKAGTAALGLLVPPGRRTLVIVRPRNLPWDLLVVQSDRRTGPSTIFRDFGRDEASAAVEGFYSALQHWTEDESLGRVHSSAHEMGFLVRAQIDLFPLLTCLRQAGQPYQPLLFTSISEADAAASALRTILRPAQGMEQEVYFNDRHFSRG